MVGDPVLEEPVARIRRLADAKLQEMEGTLALARAGRIGQAIQSVRSGEGKRYMDELRVAIDDFDALKSARIADRTHASERSAFVTVLMNAMTGLLVLILALLSAWMVRRYVGEIQRAREELDAVNAGLEDTVRDRTAALTRANDEIQRFAYIVSHDLRAPLVNVMGYTSELEQAGKVIDAAIREAEAEGPVSADVVTAVREDMPEALGFIRASTERWTG